MLTTGPYPETGKTKELSLLSLMVSWPNYTLAPKRNMHGQVPLIVWIEDNFASLFLKLINSLNNFWNRGGGICDLCCLNWHHSVHLVFLSLHSYSLSEIKSAVQIICYRFPFYYEIKIILVLWLLSPATKGSSILYRKFVHPMLSRREQVNMNYDISYWFHTCSHVVSNVGNINVDL